MEEILRNLGVKIESWIISFFAATIFIVMKIYESETPPSRRRVVYIITSGIATAVLVPGLIVYWFNIDNPFAAGFATAVVVMTFELIVQAIKDRVIKKLKMEKMEFKESISNWIRTFLLNFDIEFSVLYHKLSILLESFEVQWIQRIIIVIIGAFILITSLISHIQIKKNNMAMAKEMLRRTGKETLGGKVFFYSMILFCLNSFYFGFTPFVSGFAVLALVSERLIVYRVCRGQKDVISRFLTKINW